MGAARLPDFDHGSGTAVRLGWNPKLPNEVSLLVHCATSLIADLRPTLESTLRFEGNRAVVLTLDEPMPTDAIKLFVECALTYHLRTHHQEQRAGSGAA